MTARELARRPVALGLLTALPLAFYGSAANHSDHAAITGGLAMAFSMAGASIFAALTARPVDQRLILAGYHPSELLLGRLLLLELFGLAVGALAPHELEGVLILIGVVGVQLTLESTQTIAKLLPFWGPQRLIQHSIEGDVAIGAALPVGVAYALALLGLAAYISHARAPSVERRRTAS